MKHGIFAAIAVATFATTFTSCTKNDEDFKTHYTPGHAPVTVQQNNNNDEDPYGAIEPALFAKWEEFVGFLEAHTELEYQSNDTISQNLRKALYDSVVVTGAVTQTSYTATPFARLNVERKTHEKYSRDIATLCVQDRNIEIGPHRHESCGLYDQQENLIDVVLIANDGSQFVWRQAPIQVQWGWKDTPTQQYNHNQALGFVTGITVHLQ